MQVCMIVNRRDVTGLTVYQPDLTEISQFGLGLRKSVPNRAGGSMEKPGRFFRD